MTDFIHGVTATAVSITSAAALRNFVQALQMWNTLANVAILVLE
jgi:uroporphyrinogen-III synthase